MTEKDEKDDKEKNGYGKSSEEQDDRIVSMSEFRSRLEEEKKRSDDQNFKKKKIYQRKELIPSNQNAAPFLNVPPVTKYLVLIFITVFGIQYFGPMAWDYWMMQNLGFVPAKFSGLQPMEFWSYASPFTYSFLHGSWLHVIMNCLMLLAFGAGIERGLGAKEFLNIYLLGVIVGGVSQFLLDPSSQGVIVGASGGISGLFGAILVVMQRAGSLGPNAKLLPFILLWVGISVFFGMFGVPGESNDIAWLAHLGGFFAGLLYVKFWLKH